jgi:hypothetical protein
MREELSGSPTTNWSKLPLITKRYSVPVMWAFTTITTGKLNINPNYSDKPPYTRPVRTVV